MSLKKEDSLLHPSTLGLWYIAPSSVLRGFGLTYYKIIEAALRDCVRLPVKEFALVVVLENGEEKTYTSQSLTPYQPNIFTDNFRHDFWRNLRRAASDTEGWYPNSGWLMVYSYTQHCC